MPIIVPPAGPKTAKLILIGESAGETEVIAGYPFAGKAGGMLDKWLVAAGIDRWKDCYIDNVYPILPPGKKMENVPKEELEEWIEKLYARLAGLPNIHCIIAIGAYALYALTGYGTQSKLGIPKEKKIGIHALRGSILSSVTTKIYKVIPIIHPAALMYSGQFQWEAKCIADLRKAKQEAAFPELKLPQRNHQIWPSESLVRATTEVIEELPANAKIALDIETWGSTLSCLGVAPNIWISVTIPTSNKELYEKHIPYIKRICESRCEKVLQNGLYDTYWLRDHGIEVNNWKWDTMYMHHALDARETHSLEFLASIYTREPYWKNEAKSMDEINKIIKGKTKEDLDRLWTYNGKDACLTLEIYYALRRELEEKNLLDFYREMYGEMLAPMLDAMTHGVRVNVEKLEAWSEVLKEEMEQVREELEKLAGEELWAKKAPARMKLVNFFYKTLKAPPQRNYKSKTKGLSVDESSLLRVATHSKATKLQKEAVRLLLLWREKKGEFDQIYEKWDKDGRMRCSYKFVETGRFSSSENPKGSGRNLQNVKR